MIPEINCTIHSYDGITWFRLNNNTSIATAIGSIACGDGKFVMAGSSKIMYTGFTSELIDTSNNNVLSTTMNYDYTANIADDGKTFRWILDDGIDTVTRDIVLSIQDIKGLIYNRYVRLGNVDIWYSDK
jgi:hypothetical protein